MSGGRLTVQLHAAGELVPALQVFDAVQCRRRRDGPQRRHSTGPARPVPPPTSPPCPSGLTPLEHIAWIEHGGGQALWDELYAPFGLKPFMAGSSGLQMGGWFRRELKVPGRPEGPQDPRRRPLRRASSRSWVPIAVVAARGRDLPGAAERCRSTASSSWARTPTVAQGFYQVAPFYYWPTFTKPNGTAECIIRREAWDALAGELQAIVAEACRAENQVTLSESEWRAAEALAGPGRQPQGPAPRLARTTCSAASHAAAEEVLAEVEAAGAIEARIARAYREALTRIRRWSAVSAQAYLGARELA